MASFFIASSLMIASILPLLDNLISSSDGLVPRYLNLIFFLVEISLIFFNSSNPKNPISLCFEACAYNSSKTAIGIIISEFLISPFPIFSDNIWLTIILVSGTILTLLNFSLLIFPILIKLILLPIIIIYY